jgi:hypothetical protein
MSTNCPRCAAPFIVRQTIKVRGVIRRLANGKPFAWCPNGCRSR